METPRTLLDAITFFQDPENCRRFMIAVRWEDGIVRCPRCGSENVSYMPNAKQYHCKAKQHKDTKFSLKVGTIFEDSPIGLEKWLPAAWLISNCKNGISSYEVARALGITQKSAWHMLHRLREAMAEDGGQIGIDGPVEMDETFVGGKVKNMHKAKIKKQFHGKGTQGGHGKAVVMGMLERGGQVRAVTVIDRRKHSIDPVVSANVADGAHIITDEFDVYNRLSGSYYHEVIMHIEGYVREHVHTNGIENFWALLKRGLGGTYISVDPYHLQAYVAEQVYRFNNRATKENPMTDADRFEKTLSQIVGKRLTYAELTGRLQSRA
jgi:transposase-like protein